MNKTFATIGALIGLFFVPLAAVAGGAYAILRFGFRQAKYRVQRDIIDKVDES